MHKFSVIAAVVCFALTAVIILYGEGLRVVYSGGFFALMGIVMLVNARRWKRGKTD
jgi:hypothetical protein